MDNNTSFLGFFVRSKFNYSNIMLRYVSLYSWYKPRTLDRVWWESRYNMLILSLEGKHRLPIYSIYTKSRIKHIFEPKLWYYRELPEPSTTIISFSHGVIQAILEWPRKYRYLSVMWKLSARHLIRVFSSIQWSEYLTFLSRNFISHSDLFFREIIYSFESLSTFKHLNIKVRSKLFNYVHLERPLFYGNTRTKKKGRLKRRMTKRLVKRTQSRSWVVFLWGTFTCLLRILTL